MNNPIKYTSRTFQTIMADLNSDVEIASKPSWWKRVWAGVGDVTSMWLNGVANNLSIRRAYTRESIEELAQLLAFQYTTVSPARTSVIYNSIDGITLPLTIARSRVTVVVDSTGYACNLLSDLTFSGADLAIVITSSTLFTSVVYLYSGQKVRVLNASVAPLGYYFVINNGDLTYSLATTLAEALAGTPPVTLSSSSGSYNVTDYSSIEILYQQGEVALFQLGTADGTAWKRFTIDNAKVVSETVSVFVGGVAWSLAPNWYDVGATDESFVLVREEDITFVEFGDSQFGAVPPNLSVITCQFDTTEGILGNTTGVEDLTYTGISTDVESVTAIERFDGGTDAQSIEQIRRLAPSSVRSNERFVFEQDAKDLIGQYFPAIKVVGTEANWDGPLTTRIQALVTGGAEASTTLRNQVKAFLESRSLLELCVVTMNDTVFVTVTPTITYAVLEGANAKVASYLKTAYYLLLTERGQEFVEFTNEQLATALYEDIGVVLDDEQDLAVLESLRELIPPAEYEKYIYGSTIGGLQAVIPYLDYYYDNLTYPIVVPTGRITTAGTITVVEA